MDTNCQSVVKSKILLIPLETIYLEVNKENDFEKKLYF